MQSTHVHKRLNADTPVLPQGLLAKAIDAREVADGQWSVWPSHWRRGLADAKSRIGVDNQSIRSRGSG